MRDFKGMKRQRGRNRKPGGGSPSNANNANPNRSWDSQGPENIKVRGNAQTVYERYLQLGRDATAAGDRVLAENYLQHAEHYFRVLRALQPARPVSEIAARELSNQGYDIDFEDETGAQAAAFLAAQQAADRAAQQSNEPRSDYRQDGDQPREQNQNRDNNRNNDNRGDNNRSEGGQREWRDRDQNQNRDRDNNRDRDQNKDRDNQNRDGQQPRAEGEEGGPRRETRRERWERRREERNRRFEAEGGVGEAPDNAPYDAGSDSHASSEARADAAAETAAVAPATALAGTPYEPAADDAPKAKTERPRRTRMPRENDADEGPSSLPGFLTRSSAPAAAIAEPVAEPVAASDDETPAPKKRSPRRKPDAVVAETATED